MPLNLVTSGLEAIQANPWTFAFGLTSLLLLLSVAAIVRLLMLLERRGQAARTLAQRLEAETEKVSRLEQTVASLRAQIPPPPAYSEPEQEEQTPEPPQPHPLPDGDLADLTQNYLVREFVAFARSLAPQGLELPPRPLELDPSQESRLLEMLTHLDRIASLTAAHGAFFPIEYYTAKAGLHLARHETGLACETLTEARRLYPEETSITLPLARLLVLLNRDREAADLLEPHVHRNPTDSAAVLLLTRTLLHLGDAAKAEPYARILLHTGIDPNYRSLLALCLFRRGLVSRAEEIAGPLRKDKPSPTVDLHLGLIDEENGRLKEALQRFLRAKNAGLEDPELLRGLVRLNALLGQHAANKKLLEEVRSRPDLDATALLLFLESASLVWSETKLYRSLCERLADLRRSDPVAFTALATVLLRSGEPDKALEALRRARDFGPNHPVVLSRTARVLLDRKDLETAAETIGHGLTVAPTDPLFAALRCEHLGLTADRETALAEARKAVERFPHSVPNLELFARLLLRLGEGREALRLLLRVEEAGVKSPALYNLIGSACFLLKDHAAAAKAWNRALELDPRNLEALNNLGVVHGLRHEYRQAKKMFSRALQVDPASKETHYNLARLHRLINEEAETRHMTRYRQLVGG